MAQNGESDQWQTSETSADNESSNEFSNPSQKPTDTSSTEIEDYSLVELEVCFEGEPDLHQSMRNCKKYPDHKDFIPVNQFNIDHLPSRYRDNDIVELIRALSALTVRIKVRKPSPSRPQPPYPPNPRIDRFGRECSINGTGWVKRIATYSEKEVKMCSCRECKNSPNAQKQWGHIEVMTAAHVIHDEIEAKNTTMYLDYDTHDIDLSSVATLSDIGGVWRDVREDTTVIFCYTHDMALVDRLNKMEGRYRDIQKKVMDKYFDSDNENEFDDDLTVIVSHPHGCSKHVTVGELRERMFIDYDENLGRYLYTTPTCPGSSGGPVFILGKGLWYDEHPHSGFTGATGLNRSAISFD